MTKPHLNMLKAILCDFDGVLYRLNKDCALTLLMDVKHKLRIPAHLMLERYFFSNPYFREIDTGTLSYAEMLGLIQESCWSGSTADWLEIWEGIWACYEPSVALLAILEAFLESGFPVVIITDNHKDFRSWLLRNTSLASFEQHLICSAELGICKPEPRIFALALAMAKSKPEYTCYIDDNVKNVNAANKLNIVGLHFTNETSTIKRIMNLILSPE